MGWNEYLIKCYAYNRMEIKRLENLRFMAFHTRLAPHYEAPKTMQSMLPLPSDGVTVDSEAKDRATAKLKEKRKHKTE